MFKGDLPEKWVLVNIGDKKYFNLTMGQSPPSKSYNSDEIGLPFFQGKAEFGELYPMPQKYCSQPLRIAEKNDILISVRAPVGPTNLASCKCCIGRGLAAIKCKEKVLPKFLLFALRSIETDIAGSVQDQGGGFTAIKREQLEAIEIPIPPLEEQQRIVSRIEALTKRVEEARKLRQYAIEEISKYFIVAISKFFENKKSSGWQIKKIKELCKCPQYGFTASATDESKGPKFLRITDIQDGNVNWNTVPYCLCAEIEKYKLQSGDILFARTGATTGKSYLITETPETAIFASYLIRLRAKEEILPEFLYWYFQSSFYWHSVYSGVEDGNRPNMNGTKLANLKIPFPSEKNEQRRIVGYLEKLQNNINKLKNHQKETEVELNNFTPTLLAKAFRGEF